MKAIRNSALGLTGIIGVVVSMFGIKVPFAESLAKEYWRYGLIALLLIILVMPALIGLFLYLFDANKFKAEIVQFVKVQTQRELVLQGDIKVTFFPKLGLDSGKMSLSQRNSARQFASVNNARLYVAWLPLLRKQLVFDRVEIDGIHANVIRLKDGTTNFDDLLTRGENLPPMTFDIDGVHVTNSSIDLNDDMELQRVALRDLQLETGRLADTVPGHLTASFHLHSEKASSDARVELKTSLFFDRKAGCYEFADVEGKLEGTAAGINNMVLSFRGDLDTYPAQRLLTAENVSATMTGMYGERNVEARLSVPRIQIGKGMISGSRITVEATSTQPSQTLATTLNLPVFEIANKTVKAPELGADLDFSGKGGTLQGRLTSALDINFENATTLRLDKIAMDLVLRHPALSEDMPVKATGSVRSDFASQSVSLDFNAKIDNSEISGTAALRDFSRPAYSFDLNTNHLDLDRYLAADWIRSYQDDATPLDLGALKGLTATGRLRAGEFKVAKFKADKLVADIRIEKSALEAGLLGNFCGGILTGSFGVTTEEVTRVTLKENLKGFQMGALLDGTSAAGKLAGKGDLVADLSAEGNTVGALRKSINGDVSLALARGTIAGIDLRAALLEGRNELGNPGGARTLVSNFAEKTEFTELKAVFNFKEGRSSAGSFEMKSPLIRTEGELALESGNVGYRLNATVASTLNRRTAGELAELKGVTVPIQVSGPFAAPSIALDFAAASGDLVVKRIAARAAAKKAASRAAEEQAAAEQAAAAAQAGAATAEKHVKPVKKRSTKAGKK